jgi:hypothetical protein
MNIVALTAVMVLHATSPAPPPACPHGPVAPRANGPHRTACQSCATIAR